MRLVLRKAETTPQERTTARTMQSDLRLPEDAVAPASVYRPAASAPAAPTLVPATAAPTRMPESVPMSMQARVQALLAGDAPAQPPTTAVVPTRTPSSPEPRAMIITRTPFRVSFFGGGTDYPAWYNASTAATCSRPSIDKYCYITCRLPAAVLRVHSTASSTR